jgi:hypothetical protein
VFLTLRDQRWQQQRWVSATETANNYAPRVFGAYSREDRDGFQQRDFRQATERLLRGLKPPIVIEESGPGREGPESARPRRCQAFRQKVGLLNP